MGDDADVFGPVGAPGDNRANVAFADTSTETALGQLFVAHNDGPGIHIAHFDEADGSLVEALHRAGHHRPHVASVAARHPGGARRQPLAVLRRGRPAVQGAGGDAQSAGARSAR